jgi:hypothetical protein
VKSPVANCNDQLLIAVVELFVTVIDPLPPAGDPVHAAVDCITTVKLFDPIGGATNVVSARVVVTPVVVDDIVGVPAYVNINVPVIVCPAAIVVWLVAGETMMFGAVPDKMSDDELEIVKLFVVKPTDQFVCDVPLFVMLNEPVPVVADVSTRVTAIANLNMLTGGTNGANVNLVNTPVSFVEMVGASVPVAVYVNVPLMT